MKTGILIEKVFQLAEPRARISSIDKQLLENSFLVVLENNKFIGILTPADIAESPHELVVDCLNGKPHVDYDADVKSVLEIMNEGNVFVLPVFKAGEFVGVITKNTITAFLDSCRKEIESEIHKKRK